MPWGYPTLSVKPTMQHTNEAQPLTQQEWENFIDSTCFAFPYLMGIAENLKRKEYPVNSTGYMIRYGPISNALDMNLWKTALKVTTDSLNGFTIDSYSTNDYNTFHFVEANGIPWLIYVKQKVFTYILKADGLSTFILYNKLLKSLMSSASSIEITNTFDKNRLIDAGGPDKSKVTLYLHKVSNENDLVPYNWTPDNPLGCPGEKSSPTKDIYHLLRMGYINA